MSSPPSNYGQTPSQTAGPFLHIGFAHLCRDEVIEPSGGAATVRVTGRVFDGDAAPVPGLAVNSDCLDGLATAEASAAIIPRAESAGWGAG